MANGTRTKPPKHFLEVGPSGMVRHVIDFRGTKDPGPSPAKVQCDYCMVEADRLWCRKTRAFGVNVGFGNYVYEGGYWRACAYCRSILDPKYSYLLAEWVAVRAKLDVGSSPVIAMRILWAAVWSAFDGSPEIEWAGGTPVPLG